MCRAVLTHAAVEVPRTHILKFKCQHILRHYKSWLKARALVKCGGTFVIV